MNTKFDTRNQESKALRSTAGKAGDSCSPCSHEPSTRAPTHFILVIFIIIRTAITIINDEFYFLFVHVLRFSLLGGHALSYMTFE
jgi:hypothetical protein